MGNTFAHLSWSGNTPVCVLLLISAAILGDKTWPTFLIILGPRQSNPVALDVSSAAINVETCSGVINGILKNTSSGTLWFIKLSSSLRSDDKASVPWSLKISEIEVKYSFNCVATYLGDVYLWLSIFISSGRRLLDVLALLAALRRCCQIVRVSLVTDLEKCSRFAFRIKTLFYFCVFLYFVHRCLRLQKTRCLRDVSISWLYQSGSRCVFTLLTLIGAWLSKCFKTIFTVYHRIRNLVPLQSINNS